MRGKNSEGHNFVNFFPPDGKFVMKTGGLDNAEDGENLDKMKSYFICESYYYLDTSASISTKTIFNKRCKESAQF